MQPILSRAPTSPRFHNTAAAGCYCCCKKKITDCPRLVVQLPALTRSTGITSITNFVLTNLAVRVTLALCLYVLAHSQQYRLKSYNHILCASCPSSSFPSLFSIHEYHLPVLADPPPLIAIAQKILSVARMAARKSPAFCYAFVTRGSLLCHQTTRRNRHSHHQ